MTQVGDTLGDAGHRIGAGNGDAELQNSGVVLKIDVQVMSLFVFESGEV